MARRHFIIVVCAAVLTTGSSILAQLIDRTAAPNASGDGVALSLAEQIGAGRGDWFTKDSSLFIINRDPFRAIRRGRQLFQRKFTVAAGVGPVMGDDAGNIEVDRVIGAGLADSCAACTSASTTARRAASSSPRRSGAWARRHRMDTTGAASTSRK
jgi:hypothetical protein